MEQKHSLTSAQIQYLKISPKVVTSTTATQKLVNQLAQFQGDGGKNLNNISKFTYGKFQNTVNNFGVLLHRNYIGTTTLHQKQKFGKIAAPIDQLMQAEKDIPAQNKKAGTKKLMDTRTSIKSIFQFKGYKILFTLSSFSVNSVQTNRTLQTLPLPFLKLLVGHVPSTKLVKVIQNAIKQQGNTVYIQFDKIQSKTGQSINNQVSYAAGSYIFERGHHQLQISLPHLIITNEQVDLKQSINIQNKDILAIIETDFDNIDQIANKYLNFSQLQQLLGKTGIDKASIPQPQ